MQIHESNTMNLEKMMSANMSSWAFNAASRFMEQERARSEKWERALQKHQTLVAQAPVLWESTRQALQSQIQAFNERVGRPVLVVVKAGDTKVAAYAHTETGPRAITVEFDPDRYWITCSARAIKGAADFEERFQLSVNANDDASIALPTGTACSADEAAGRMLNGLMGWHHVTT